MKRALFALGSLLFTFALTSCSKYYYNPAPQVLPSYIQKIAIRTFANHTRQYGLEEKLTLAVQSEFNRDGRFQITTEEQADGVLIGDITKYILEPLAYDANHVPTQYKLWILVNLAFYDKVKSQTLWTEPNLEGILNFFSASTHQTGTLTEAEAQEQIWAVLSKKILTRTLEGFGTVTGASEKSVPKSSPEQYNPSVGGPDPSPTFAPSPARSPY